MKSRLLSLPLLITLLAPLPAADELKPGANLVVEGVPAIPMTLVEGVKRYTEARGAGFAGWHPARLEMLVSTRFGNASQLHAVAAPLGMRRQLTFFDEPVSSSGYDRRDGRFFLFRRDEGGSEFAQLYRHDLADGTVTRLTDGGRHQNGGTNWSNRGDRRAWIREEAKPGLPVLRDGAFRAEIPARPSPCRWRSGAGPLKQAGHGVMAPAHDDATAQCYRR